MNQIIMMRLTSLQHIMIRNQKLHTAVVLLKKNDSSFSSEVTDCDNEKTKTNFQQETVLDEDKSKKQTFNLLTELLTQMNMNQSKTKTMDRAIPKKKRLPKPVPEPILEEKLIGAAKDAAESLGGDVKKTEADLLDKIFSINPQSSPSLKSESTTSSKTNLSELLSGMKIDRTASKSSNLSDISSNFRRAPLQQYKFRDENLMAGNKFSNRLTMQHDDLYRDSRLNIFDSITEKSVDSTKLNTWTSLEKKELKLLLLNPPQNIFQEMIQWTEMGILWRLPIDNEIGMEEEQNIHFSEHVFMDKHLEGWCPEKGPIRHFMDLVCIGLSKNPYMTVQEKKEHILWYRDFFSNKQELLKEIGAIEHDIPSFSSMKQIES